MRLPNAINRCTRSLCNFMKTLNFILAGCLIVAASVAAEDLAPVFLANPLQGTDSSPNFSHGNEYPAIGLPFPMNVWAPYTQPERDSFFYQYRKPKIRGIRQTHQPSAWMGDYATFALMPVSGDLVVTGEDRASEFSHAREIAQPSYYKVHLDTWNATAEVTPTERAARFRFTYEDPKDAYVVLNVFAGKPAGSVEIIPGENKVIGIARNNSGGVPDNFGNYFVIVFDRPFTAYGVWTPDSIETNKMKLESEKALGAYLKFDVSAGKTVGCKVASSFISAEQAARNLEKEIGDADFDTVRQRAETRWNETLGRVKVEGGSEDQRRTFYSALYRAVQFPQRFYEFDGQDHPIYYSPYDGKVHDGHMYTDSGFWDTFRAAHPLINLLFPEVSAEIQEGLLHAYDESGWLPAWSSPGHRAIMIGNHAFSLMADAWTKGITNFDAGKAVAAMTHDANTQAPPGLDTIGRDGAYFYHTLGYVPYDNGRNKGTNSYREAGAKTLEFAYDDFCAAQLAAATGHKTEAEAFANTAMNYTNLFDAKIGFMRGRKVDGTWDEPFYPEEWGGPFTEGNSWHWTWSVMQDVPGLVELMGGEKAFGDKLDAVFYAGVGVKVGSYGQMIHEMTEMVAGNMGQYAHGNEPVHHMLYLYDYAGQPWKAQSRIRQTMTLLYQPTPDGICGDEDTGQMSAWYVFSALGFYPVCPGDPVYLIGSPLFDQATISLPNNKTYIVTAKNNGPQEPYIRGAKINDESYTKVYLRHQDIANGGGITFQMASEPNYKWAVEAAARPGSALGRLRETLK